MRTAVLATILLLAATLTNADSSTIAAPAKGHSATRNLHFDWDDVKGASYYRLMYSVGSGAYRPAIDKVPAATSRATVSVPARLATRASLRYVVAACDTAGCAKSNGISPHTKPIGGDAMLVCGAGAAFAVDSTDDAGQRVCMQRVAARFFARRRFR